VSLSAWRPGAGGALSCHQRHGGLEGRLDESARRLSHPEFAVARQLTSEGHQVYALPERPGRARTADLLVCGTPVEVKSWLSQDQRRQVPGTRSVVNKLRQAEGQAATVILEGRGSGLTSVAAHNGMAMYAGLPHRGPVAAVRVLGDGFDLAWTRVRALEVTAASTGAIPRAASLAGAAQTRDWGGRPPDPGFRARSCPCDWASRLL
jgi:hypothetical protein